MRGKTLLGQLIGEVALDRGLVEERTDTPMAVHPLDPLSPTEFQTTAAILRRDQGVTDSWRFASIELKEPA